MIKNIVAFAFKGNVSSTVLKQLDIKDSFYIPSKYLDVEKFVQRLIRLKPKYILGLGMYSRIDKDKLRIETKCSLNEEELDINYFLSPLANTKLASGIGNAYCNYISTMIMEKVNSRELFSQYTFIHIPKSFSVPKAVKEIKAMINNSCN